METFPPCSALALDLGRRRIGLAGCDPLGLTVTPLSALHRGAFRDDLATLAALLRQRGARALVIGLPLDAQQQHTPQAAHCRRYGLRLVHGLARQGLSLPLAWVNEHTSSWEAAERFGLHGDRSGRLDSAAAALLLEQWLREGPPARSPEPASPSPIAARSPALEHPEINRPSEMTTDAAPMTGTDDVPTVLVSDSAGRQLLCFLEQMIPVEGVDYGLLTPVDTPVCLVRIAEDDDDEDELIEELDVAEEILQVADVVLQEHDLTLIRSAATLTVSGELEENDPEDLEDDLDEEIDGEGDDETDLYEMLIQFRAGDQEYGLYIPLDPFFVVARLDGGAGLLVEGDEFERVQPLIEQELEERESET